MFLAFLLATIVAAKAGPVDVSRAKQVGAKFINANTGTRAATAQDLRLVSTFRTTEGVAAFRVFNLDGGGWVMVAADDCSTPILGFSSSGQFDENNLPPALQLYLKGFVEQIEYGIADHMRASDSIAHQWELVQSTGRVIDDRSGDNGQIGPLIKTQWGQGTEFDDGTHYYYNILCPSDSDGPNGHTLTGCVPTSMAQIMRYWNYPEQGNGYHSYWAGIYGNQEADFGETYYDWDNMPLQLDDHDGEPNVQDTAVATLMYHCGVAVDALYGIVGFSIGSTAGLYWLVEEAFEDYFRYSTDAEFVWRTWPMIGLPNPFAQYNYPAWRNKIRQDLIRDCPVWYLASENGTVFKAHAFVCDGIRDDGYLHFNWGWNGSYDGPNEWYALGALNPGDNHYNYTNAAIFGIHPPTSPLAVILEAAPEAGGTIESYYVTSTSTQYIHDPEWIPYGETLHITAVPNTGYHLSYWTDGEDNVLLDENNDTITDLSMHICEIKYTVHEIHYTAHFEPNKYEVAAISSPAEGGLLTGAGIYDYSTICTLTAMPNPGYHFDRWMNGQLAHMEPTNQFMVTGDAQWTAYFIKNSYYISANATSGGTATGTGTYEHGTTCTLQATATSPAVSFINWTKNGTVVSTNPIYSFTVTEDGDYVANFQLTDYSVTATASPSEGGTVTGGGSFNYGGYCTLTATPDSGYHFVNWTKNGTAVSTNPTICFWVYESANYVANFALSQDCVIWAVATPAAGGTVIGEGLYSYGSTCTLTAIANTGYNFLYWKKDNVTVSTNPTYSFTVTEAGIYRAFFSPGYTVTTVANPSDGGWVTGGGAYNALDQCTLIAFANEGYHFVNWIDVYGNEYLDHHPQYSNQYSFYVTQNVTVYANFAINIALDTYVLEFDELGTAPDAYNLSMTIGSDLQSSPTLEDVPDWIEAEISSDHTNLALVVAANPSMESRTCSITVRVGGYTSQPLVITQSGCSQAEFTLNPSYAVYDADDTETHSLQVSNIHHVNVTNGSSYVWANVLEMDMMGTDWIDLDVNSWNATTRSFSFSLNENTGTVPRGVMISVHLLGTDGNWISHDVTIWQNPQAAAMTLEPGELEWGETSLCVPVTKTVTVTYENAFDQQGYGGYNADYVWLDLWNLGSDFYTDIVVEPEVVPVDESGFGTATFTLTYTPTQTGYHDGTLWARIGEYDLEYHESIPGGAASPWIWASAMAYDPYFGWEKVTSTDEIESMGMTNYSLVPMDNTEQGEYVNFYNPEPGYYCIQMGTDFLTWTEWDGLSQEYFDPWMDYPENRFLWSISIDANGNATISPMDDASYHIVWNDDDEYDQHFECVTSEGNPVQIYRLKDGTIPPPTFTASADWFMDGQTLDITVVPAEGTTAVFWYYSSDGEWINGEATTPFTFTVNESISVEGYSATCSNYSEDVQRNFFKISEISTVREDANNDNDYLIKGILTYSDSEMLIIQDETGAIHASKEDIDEWIYTGDEVILYGLPQTENYGQWTTFGQAQYGLTLSEGNTVEPVVTTFYDLLSNPIDFQAQLVKVEDVTVGYHDEEAGCYYLYNSNQIMGLRDTYEGGFPFFLNEGSLIDLTAVFVRNMEVGYTDFLIRDDDEDIVVKGPFSVNMQAYSDEALNIPNSTLNSQIIYCDENGNMLDNNDIYAGTTVYFTIGNDYEVGLTSNLLPVVAVCNANTGEVIYDSYTNYQLSVYDLNGEPYRIFTFDMPNVDVVIKVWLMESAINYTVFATANPAEGGIVSGDGDYLAGATCTLTATANEDYTFVNWMSVTGEIVSTETTYSFTVTDYASYVANFASSATYTITAMASPSTGGIVTGGGTYTVGEACTLTASANAGYTFINWTKNGMVITTEADFSFIVSENADYVANFASDSYIITASASPFNGGSVTGEGSYNHGATATLTATTNEGYVFVNWSKNGETVSTDATYTFIVTESANYMANFAPNACIVTTTSNPSNGGIIEGAGTYNYGTVVTLEATANEGYSFVNWTQDGTVVWTGSNYSFIVTDATALVANFALNSYTITALAAPSNSGIVTGDGNYPAGTTCTLTAEANLGYGFTGWMTMEGESVSTEAIYTFTVTEDNVLIASFEEIPVGYYTITATANPEEGGIAFNVGSYAEGETCTLVAEAYPGYTFVNWTLDGEEVSTEVSYSFTVTEDANFVANFIGESVYFTVTATASPEEGGVIGGIGSYAYGTYCTLTATANTGYNFVYWMTTDGYPVSIDAEFNFYLFENIELVAYFEALSGNYYTITTTANPSNGGTVSGGGTYAEGETCTLTATANEGYTFVNWMSVTGAVVSTTATYTFTVTQDADFVAVFEENEPGGEITQTTNFANGWNWWSGYIELGSNGLGELQNSLGTHGMMIKSQNDGYASFLEGYGWYGSLSSINNESTYQIRTNEACTVEMTGSAANPEEHPITLSTGWTWVGYPVNASMSVAEALSGITPQNGDMLKSQNNGYASYLAGYGWYGSLNTLQPGMGLMFKSNNSSAVTLVYPTGGTRTDLKANQTTESNHWQPNPNAYPDNMSVMAVVELDGNELQGENYELAAFANGEVRGSARLLYVEPLNRHMAFLTIAGDEAAGLSFGLYDAETGMVETQNFASLQYETNAVVGSFAEPYVVSFHGTTGVDEWVNRVQVYPNPVDRGRVVSLGFENEVANEVNIEIIDALGNVVETLHTTSLQAVTAPKVVGVYTLRITVEGKGSCFRKLVVR